MCRDAWLITQESHRLYYRMLDKKNPHRKRTESKNYSLQNSSINLRGSLRGKAAWANGSILTALKDKIWISWLLQSCYKLSRRVRSFTQLSLNFGQVKSQPQLFKPRDAQESSARLPTRWTGFGQSWRYKKGELCPEFLACLEKPSFQVLVILSRNRGLAHAYRSAG